MNGIEFSREWGRARRTSATRSRFRSVKISSNRGIVSKYPAASAMSSVFRRWPGPSPIAVDYKSALRVIAKGVEESVAIGHHATGTIGDRLAQAAGGIDRGKLHDQRTVGIDVSGRIHLDEIPRALHGHSGLSLGQGQHDLELDRNSVADTRILREGCKARCRHFHAIRIRRNIAEPESAIAASEGDLSVAGDRIVDGHRSLGHRSAGGIDDTAFNGARVSQRLTKHRLDNDGKE